MSDDKPLSAKHTLLQCVYAPRQRFGHSAPVLSTEQVDDRFESDRDLYSYSDSTAVFLSSLKLHLNLVNFAW